jgi:uncharacterized membrane protein
LFFVSIATKVEHMEDVLEILALVITGPMVGVEIGVATFTNPVFARLPHEAFRQARSDGSRVLGKAMPDWLITGAAVILAIVVLLTVTMMVPINNRIGRWSDAADVDRDLATRWDRLHWLRVCLLIALYVLLVIGVVAA